MDVFDLGYEHVSLSRLAGIIAKRVGGPTLPVARKQVIACLRMGKAVAWAEKFYVDLTSSGLPKSLSGYPKDDFEIGPEFWQLSMAEDRSHERPHNHQGWIPASGGGYWHRDQLPVFQLNEHTAAHILARREGFGSFIGSGWENVRVASTASGVTVPPNQALDILAMKNRPNILKKAEALEAAMPVTSARGEVRDQIIGKMFAVLLSSPTQAIDAIENGQALALLKMASGHHNFNREWTRLADAIEEKWRELAESYPPD